MGKIYLIMGRSSCGKDTIYKKLLERGKLDLKKVIIYTTRPMREKEMDGVQYYFCSIERYEKYKEDRKIIEERTYNTMYGPWHYFTVDDGQIDLSEGNYLMIGTVDMYVSIKEYFGEQNVVPLMINVSDGMIMQRAMKRELKQEEPKYDEMCRRFLADKADYSDERLKGAGIDRTFDNDGELEACLDEIESFILSEK
ncbi:guanylate kinase [Butyrivibrio sp. INlla16]|uniref:guanylate kinase n=1 Tax=Butyrivibrio sp. INlla16 TaxID=1520807 RepID=UPI00087F7FD1|nr:guanylate kinase [Butyrivibrio sp. INlla16]SDB20322.1 Guanylate kinase [Butyrivibrio sp. INlla16]